MIKEPEGFGFVQKTLTIDFILRAQDRFAPEIINHWIELAMENGVNPEKITMAVHHRDAIIEWQRVNGSKIPD